MEKILVIDDSLLQAAKLKDILSDEYDVTTARTAEAGFDCACTGDYSLILLDVIMPGMDGFDLLKKLQEEIIIQGVPVIMISSLSDEEHLLHTGCGRLYHQAVQSINRKSKSQYAYQAV